MRENTPLKNIPLPDYQLYRDTICKKYGVTLPLPASSPPGSNKLPVPLGREKTGWPWETNSIGNQANYALPKITVVMPSFQQGRFVEAAIRSVLLQNYPQLELIIIDGGSTDETMSVLAHYKDFISFSLSEKDSGQSNALNKGFALASGEVYCWLNSDDMLCEGCLNKIGSIFSSNAHLDIVYGDGFSLEDQTGEMTFDFAPLVLERYLRFGGIVLSHSVAWRSKVHCPVWEDLQCAMDAELWLRLFTGRRSKHSLIPIGIARKHPQQKTANGSNWEKKWADDYQKYIWQWYPAVKSWKWRVYEYRLVQKMFRYYRHISGQVG